MLEHVLGVDELLERLGRWHPPSLEHSERVGVLVERLATFAGWAPERAAALGEAGRLHDVGKIGVPVAILEKPGRLDLNEILVMRRHVGRSVRMARSALDVEQTRWIAAHHERPDGTGYPRRLLGPAIPEGAALLTVADAWDVMTNARLYCGSRTVREALAECVALTGRQFTVEAVQALHGLHAYDACALTAA